MVQDTNLAFYDTRQSKLIRRTAFNMPKAAKQQTTTRPSPVAVKSEHADDGTMNTASNLPAKKGKPLASESPSPKAKREPSSKNWTAEETWQLYQLIHPKPAEVSWKELCKQFPGKDEQVSLLSSLLESTGLTLPFLVDLQSCRNRCGSSVQDAE
jgi:hypothetical protein